MQIVQHRVLAARSKKSLSFRGQSHDRAEAIYERNRYSRRLTSWYIHSIRL